MEEELSNEELSPEEMEKSPVEWLPGGVCLDDLSQEERDEIQAEVGEIEREAQENEQVGH